MKSIKERRKKQRDNINPNIKKHYTPREIVRECLDLLDLRDYFVLDVGSGLDMVWFDNLDCREKDWVEIDKGRDFFEYNRNVDWCIGNPPYRDLWNYISKSMDISKKGIAFLVAVDFWNRLTQKRLNEMRDKGWIISNIYILEVKEWFGRYFFITFTKGNNDFFSWREKGKQEGKSLGKFELENGVLTDAKDTDNNNYTNPKGCGRKFDTDLKICGEEIEFGTGLLWLCDECKEAKEDKG